MPTAGNFDLIISAKSLDVDNTSGERTIDITVGSLAVEEIPSDLAPLADSSVTSIATLRAYSTTKISLIVPVQYPFLLTEAMLYEVSMPSKYSVHFPGELGADPTQFTVD